MHTVDLLIIGGGINGCGIACDAAGRGLSVTLCEMGDIASATSSWSSKLIHGGLRYLETYDFKLVHEALKEREIIMQKAPFLTHPLKFILPYEKHLRSPWLLRLGLFLYDHLALRKKIPGSKKIIFSKRYVDNPLRKEFTFGFSYYDCQTDDSRLTLLNALSAQEQGATILTYTKCTSLTLKENLWTAQLRDETGLETTVHARAVINSTGPWVEEFNQEIARIKTKYHIQLVQGSHIVVPKLYEEDHAYILQNADNRIVFAIPYLQKFTLIGTTDTEYQGDPAQAHITTEEKIYLCDIINHYFKKKIDEADIVWSYSGVRPLFHEKNTAPSKQTREYHLEISKPDQAPYISIYGGKITTYRVLAEDVLHLLQPYFPHMSAPWTEHAALPGGDLQNLSPARYLARLKKHYAWLPADQLTRYFHAYGSRIEKLLEGAQSLEDLGQHYGADLYQREVDYWTEHELANTWEDMLWRRSKLGLWVSVLNNKNGDYDEK